MTQAKKLNRIDILKTILAALRTIHPVLTIGAKAQKTISLTRVCGLVIKADILDRRSGI